MEGIYRIISDIELRIYGGKPSDDATITHAQIAEWINDINKTLLSEWIKKEGIPNDLVKTYDCIALTKEQIVCGCTTKQYFELPVDALSLPEDKGIIQIIVGNKPFYPLKKPSQVRLFKNLPFNQGEGYYYREGNKIYLFNRELPSFCKVSVTLISSDITNMSYSEDMPTVDELIPMIKAEAVKIGLAQLGSRYDTLNDGTDNGDN